MKIRNGRAPVASVPFHRNRAGGDGGAKNRRIRPHFPPFHFARNFI
nr:MAG TPA: hypothetical protein [Caudoviricetes sp.]